MTEKLKRGRKKKICTDATLRKVEKLASRGLYDKDIWPIIGINRDLFYEWKRENSDFSEALDRGRSIGHHDIADKLFESAMAGNVSAMQYFLARRCGWSDTQQYQALDEKGERTKWNVTFVNSDLKPSED